MSTRIYGGVKLDGIETLQDIIAFAESLRPGIETIVKEDTAETLKTVACLLYDQYHACGVNPFDAEDRNRIPLLTAVHRLRAHNKNTEYTLSFGFAKGHTLAIPYFHDPKSLAFFHDHSQVTFFGYWDNSDPDPDATEDEWKLREEVWDEVFEGSDVPADVMVSIRILNPRIIVPDDDMMITLPTVEEREQNLAKTLAFDQVDTESNLKPHQVMDRCMEVIDEILPTVQGKLNPDLTSHMLEQTVPRKEDG
jgi:hypothetical protein